jgi:GDP-4-dehydro-6-deoxy-D-mannose reductase
VPVTVEIDPQRYRPVDRPAMIGSFTALEKATGWRPEVPLARSVEDTLAYWRAAPESVSRR